MNRVVPFAVLCLSACASPLNPGPAPETPDSGFPANGQTVDGGEEISDGGSGLSETIDAGVPQQVSADSGVVSEDGGVAETSCGLPPSSSADLRSDGPLSVTEESSGPNCQIFRPSELVDGRKYPVIVWGNGTSSPVSLYQAAFEYWASHGFVVLAATALDGQGSGEPQTACLDWLLDAASSGAFWQDKLCSRIGATGHSQGGAGALMLGMDPRITATAPVQPYTQQGWGGYDTSSITSQIASPMLLLSGTADNNAIPSVFQQPVFDNANVPVFWANKIGADHYFSALGLRDYRQTLLLWFRLHLMGDESQRDVFYGTNCTLCADQDWMIQRRPAFEVDN